MATLYEAVIFLLGRAPSSSEMRITRDTNGIASISNWSAPEPKPTDEQLNRALIILSARPSAMHRWDGEAWVPDFEKGWMAFREITRPPLLLEADYLVNAYLDDALDTSAARRYRKALKDIPEMQSDPFAIVLPTKPPKP